VRLLDPHRRWRSQVPGGDQTEGRPRSSQGRRSRLASSSDWGPTTPAEIAGELYISEGTAKNNVSKILRKLGLRDRTQLALYAARRWPDERR